MYLKFVLFNSEYVRNNPSILNYLLGSACSVVWVGYASARLNKCRHYPEGTEHGRAFKVKRGGDTGILTRGSPDWLL